MEEDEDHGGRRPSQAEARPEPARRDGSSFVEFTKIEPDYEHHFDSMTEEEHVRAHLREDVESSFIPPASPAIEVTGPEAGIDDTYLFDVAPRKPPTPANADPATATTTATITTTATATAGPAAAPAPAQQHERPDSPTAPITTPQTAQTNQQLTRQSPATAFTTEAPAPAPAPVPAPALLYPESARSETSLLPESRPDNAVESNISRFNSPGTASAFDYPSSPTPAAAARALSRATSAATNAKVHRPTIGPEDSDAPASHQAHIEEAHDNYSFSTAAPTLNQSNSDVATNRLSVDAESVANALKVAKRPKYLRSRTASQRSSTSSFLTSDDVESDATINLSADYALQTGGAAPTFGLTRSASNHLSRSLSMGSMASGFDDGLDPMRTGPLEPLEEVESPAREHFGDTLATPKASRGPLNPPTDTVIAQHVRNIQVPESLAKEYQTKGDLSTPLQSYRKLSDYTPAPSTVARSSRNMTLKEQSSTIERLSKENFDLKLKVMFLSDRLDKLSEEGIKEMISENVELRTSLAVIQRDNKMLRRRVKELGKRHHDDEGRPSTARSGFSSEGRATPTFESGTQANEEEIILLREQIEEYVREIERLRSDHMSSELEKMKLVETVKTMGDRATERVGESLGRQDEAEVWKDLLEQETARREQSDEENRRLRDEIFALKQEMNGSVPVGGGALHHTTNIYNITRKPRPTSPSRSRPVSGLSGDADPANSMSQSSTLVDELRRESEKLRHENAELRREVGAQTSMLTSRNREKERLYQEIEELKLVQRRGGPAPSTLDSLLDRSASRVGAHDRPISRGSGRSRLTVAAEDPGREELENKIAEQRDKVNELKFKNQELQRELESCMADFEEAVGGRRQAEDNAAATQEELENAMNDLITLQAERDEALQDQAAWEGKFVDLQQEAQGLVNELEAEADQKTDDIQRLQLDLQDRSDNFEALQEEMRGMTDALIRLEDEQAKTQKRIEQLEQELSDSGKELEDLEDQLLESNEKAQRMGVQQESSQGEIAFLREEQEGDKIRIGDLEAALASAEQIITDERDRVRELDQRLANERKQHELIASREKEEVQQIVNDLNRETSAAKEEARVLRKSLGNREVEATQWKERLMELENNLREALGDLNGTRSSLLQVRCGSHTCINKSKSNVPTVDCHASTRTRGHRSRT